MSVSDEGLDKRQTRETEVYEFGRRWGQLEHDPWEVK